MKSHHLGLAMALAAAACAGHTTPAAAPATARAAAAPAEPTALRYTPGTGRYRLESATHVEQDMMGQTSAVDIASGAIFTVALAEEAGNLGAAITIDSLGISGTVPGAAPTAEDLAAARGRTVRLVVSPLGRSISSASLDSAGPALQQIAVGLREFFPALPPAGLTAGTTWTDTISVVTSSSGIPITVRMTRQHVVGGWEDRDGTRALHLTTTSSYTVSGSGEAQGQSLQVSGGGQSSAEAFVSAAGLYLGSTVSDSAVVNANVVTAGIVIPVRRRSHSTFTRLP